jgi:hypothetical protein
MRTRRNLAAIGLLVVLVTVFFAKELFTDATLVTFRLDNVYPWLAEATREDLSAPSVTSDCTLSYYPRRVFATEMIRQGKMPFWNPHQFCGTPFFANYQSAVFYPVNLAIYWADPATQMDIFLYVHFLIAAVFTFLLGRKLGLSLQASTIASLAFTFCSFLVTRYGQPTLVSTAAWLPAVFYFAEHLLASPDLRRAGFLGLALAMTVLAGFPQLVLFVLYAVGLYVLLRVFLNRAATRRVRVATLVLLALSGAAACLVCAFQLLPTYELGTFSYRKLLPYGMILSSAHTKFVALKYFIPDILGDPLGIGVISKALTAADQGPSFARNYVGTTGYVGVLPLVLALLALVRPNRRMLPFVALGAVALLAVFGTPLLRLFYHVLPGFNFSRIDRVVVIYMFSVSVLAGYGFDAARAGGGRLRLVMCGAGFMVFAALLVLWLRHSGMEMILKQAGDAFSLKECMAYASGKMLLFLVLAALSGTLLVLMGLRWLGQRALFIAALAIVLLDLVPAAAKFKVSQPAGAILPPSSVVNNLTGDRGLWRIAKFRNDVLPANLATLVGIDDVHGYDALNVRHYIEVLGALDSSLIDVSNAALRRRIGPIGLEAALDSRVLDLLNVKYVLRLTRGEGSRRIVATRVNEDFLPRAFLVEAPRFLPTYEQVLARMKTAEFDPRREVLLRGDGGEAATAAGGAVAPGSGGEPGPAEIVKYDATDLEITAEARTRCYLVVSDVYYPGWRAFVDGREAPILRADYAFRAVELRPGRHVVRMTYRPPLFTVGLLFSTAGVALLAVMISSERRRTGGGRK